MPKYFFPAGDAGEALTLRGETAHHLLHVLRLKPGARITLCDGNCRDYAAVLREVDAKGASCLLELSPPVLCETEPFIPVTLYQALPKGDKMETVIQKSVELGVHKIIPLYTAHSLVKNAEKKIARYQKIAEAAAGQSMRGIIPLISPPMKFPQALGEAFFPVHWLVAVSPSEAPDHSPPVSLRSFFRAHASGSIGLWIGPEGGFSPEEITALIAAGATPITLGKRVLRTETAALAALAQINGITE
ncbi:MAG: 16S rRNA (uracil(1498)-N(3))-methyltransferase [Defluviitaleaceae bacterium]|nr:16S rRNA (uracil(1498)-N(3))-methyltransferase [Defluviitaleaceae bacterium]MCL2239839.1 16S rRNA (uracil(1498)-N(3))-methyltransferase [Defluviitaleaceae bacterium]